MAHRRFERAAHAAAFVLAGLLAATALGDAELRLELVDPDLVCFDNGETFDVNVVADGFAPLLIESAQYRVTYDSRLMFVSHDISGGPLTVQADFAAGTGTIDIAQAAPPGQAGGAAPATIAVLTFQVVSAEEYCGAGGGLAGFGQYHYNGQTLFQTKLGYDDGSHEILDSGDFVSLEVTYLNNDGSFTWSDLPTTTGQCIVEPCDVTDPTVTGCGPITLTREVTAGPTGDGCDTHYEYDIEWTAEDECGNTDTRSLHFAYKDTTGPTATAPPNAQLQCMSEVPDPATSYDEFVAQGGTADDNCTDPEDLEFASADLVEGDPCDPEGATVTRTYTVTDPCSGLSVEVVQVFTVKDDTPPIIQNPDPETIECWAPDMGPPAPEPWNHKMHYPQLPDPYGWDVKATIYHPGFPDIVLADDWMCTESGLIRDIHFWGSWYLGNEDLPLNLIQLRIYADLPADDQIPYSRPGELLWEHEVPAELVGMTRLVDYDPPAVEGWYRPGPTDFVNRPDHDFFYRYDVTIPDEWEPLWQEEGTIYWLSIAAAIEGGGGGQNSWGWKTTNSPWNDNAVYWHIPGDYDPQATPEWYPLTTPEPVETDLAFVITGGGEPPVLGMAYAEDNCDGDVDVTFEQFLDPDAAQGFRNNNDDIMSFQFMRVWTATDECGNIVTCTPQIITVIDTTPPYFTGIPEDLVLECDPSVYADIEDWLGSAVAEDACCLGPPGVVASHTAQEVLDALGGCCQTGTVDVTWTATDCHRNTATITRPITVQDTQPPVITNLQVSSGTVDENCEATVTFSATVSDACCLDKAGIGVSVTADGGTLTYDPLTDLTITSTGSNAFSISGTATISDLDGNPCPAEVTVSIFAIDGCGNTNGADQEATSPADGAWSESHVGGGAGQPGNVVHAWSDGDGAQWEVTGPTLVDTAWGGTPGDSVLTTRYSGGAMTVDSALWGGTGTVNASILSWTHYTTFAGGVHQGTEMFAQAVTEGGIGLFLSGSATLDGAAGAGTDPPSGYPPFDPDNTNGGQYGTVVDIELVAMQLGATATGYFDDEIPPVIQCPDDVTVECNELPAEPDGWLYKMHYPQLPDIAGWDVNATYPKVLADDWMCTESGPVRDIHFWGSWKDISDPLDGEGDVGVIDAFNIRIYADIPASESPTGYSMPGELLWEYETSDVGGVPFDPPAMEGWYDPNTGEWFPDDHGAYFRYDIIFQPDGSEFYQEAGMIYWLSITAFVACDDPQPMWGWKSTDSHWNDDAVFGDGLPPSQWVEMYEPPEFMQSLDLAFVITADGGEPPKVGQAYAEDNCGGLLTLANGGVTYSDSGPTGGVITRTWTATDACGNPATCDQLITLVDTEDPYFTDCPGNQTVGNDEGECYATVSWDPPTAEDACDPNVEVVCDPTSPQEVDVGDTLTVTCTATDDAGNTATCTFTITVEDQEDPVQTVACPEDITVPPTSEDCNYGYATWDPPEFTDNCPNLSVTSNYDPGDEFPAGATTTVTYTATDEAGNSVSCSFTVTVLSSAVFDMTVELVGGPFVLNTPFNRCIEFKLYDCTQPPATQLVATYRQRMTFTSTDGITAVATMVIGSLPCGNFTCVTARDPLHTLRSTVELGTGLSILPTGHWQADFVSGDALISGNSDGIGGPYGGQIDIVDFTQLAYQWNQTVGADTTCETPAPHTDFSGDGYVDLADWSFLLYNFGQVSQPVCCQSRGEADEPEIREEISVRELESLGLGYLRVVDVDGDGWITMTDVQKYIELQQSQPEPQDTGQIRPPGVQQLSGDR